MFSAFPQLRTWSNISITVLLLGFLALIKWKIQKNKLGKLKTQSTERNKLVDPNRQEK